MKTRSAISRRDFVKATTSFAAIAAGTFSGVEAEAAKSPRDQNRRKTFIDTNVYLGQWPFRRLPFDNAERLVALLKEHGVTQAWAGSFDGVFHKDIGAANARLAEACRRHGRGILVPFGSVNLSWPDWKNDLQRCAELKMPGIRLHPNYHGYSLGDPKFEQALRMAAERKLLVQLVASMEDSRVQHPLIKVAPLFTKPDDAKALVKVVAGIPGLRMQLLNALQFLRGDALRNVIECGKVSVDFATLEGVGGLGTLLKMIPTERVLFGSYAPFFIFESAELKIRESALAAEQEAAVLGQNAVNFVSV